ncbi:signal peptidase I [Streptomyces venezuelae]|uniref:Signal peptidase I n=1 Tax=Streptomyces venezuelae TaxID=54571 RepID=A0A5P2CQ12_STRVZ|nr:signal peptidase I [Streptomyces venezuelae]QES44107.1 signal peptidase I [Streptomyces venezuelae]
MDTEAQHTERDRSSPPSDTGDVPDVAEASEETEERSRSVFASLVDRVPGGGFTLSFLLCVGALLLVSAFVVQPFQIPSGSMEPAFRSGDRVLVNKLAYRFGSEPRRGDAVVFDGSGYFGEADYIKRVVGTGGDRVVCCDKRGRVQVNGEPIDEPYLYPGDAASKVPFDVVVPEGSLFLLGDHRGDSRDSRDHLGEPGGGMIPVDAVIGRADWIAWPIGRWTSLERPDSYARVPTPGGAHG